MRQNAIRLLLQRIEDTTVYDDGRSYFAIETDTEKNILVSALKIVLALHLELEDQ